MYYYLFLALVIGSVVICYRLENSRIGRAWMAIREDEIAAKAMGINTRNMKLLAFGMGATFGGVAGSMFGAFQGFVSPESFSLTESIAVLAMVVLGGIGQDGQVAFLFDFFQALHDLETVELRHLQVKQDEVVAMLAVQGANLLRQHGGRHIGISGVAQDFQHQIDIVSAIVNYQDLGIQNLIRAWHGGLGNWNLSVACDSLPWRTCH